MTRVVIHGDCMAVMREMEAESVDAVVCDPPYGLEFMGHDWDSFRVDTRQIGDETFHASDASTPFGRVRHGVGGSYGGDGAGAMRAFQVWCEAWAREAFRVLKPGGHMLAFGGSRTYHRMATGIEDAGFEIRDQLQWMYGTGFPKSLDVSKAIDKAAGVEREVIGFYESPEGTTGWKGQGQRELYGEYEGFEDGAARPITAPGTEDARTWAGWGTALKPAHEPVVLARKPLAGTVVETVLAHGTGALNIDGCRIEGIDPANARRLGQTYGDGEGSVFGQVTSATVGGSLAGRWPANVLLGHADGCEHKGARRVRAHTGRSEGDPDGHGIYGKGFPRGDGVSTGKGDADGMELVEAWRCVPECAVRLLDEQSGELAAGTRPGRRSGIGFHGGASGQDLGESEALDGGGASRFFFSARGSLPIDRPGETRFRYSAKASRAERSEAGPNEHPTVKPVDVMAWLVRLVTPPGGVVLDPFAGSGTTGVACVREGVEFVGIEQSAEYVEIARRRIEFERTRPVQLGLL